jgi:hypothetical protein
MKISKIHERFSDYLEDPKVLTNPEDYLGPNWEDVINFWLYLDTLSESEISKIGDRYYALDYHVSDAARLAARLAARDSAEEVVGEKVKNAAWLAAFYISGDVFAYATEELLTHHKLLEQGKTLVALPLCLEQ